MSDNDSHSNQRARRVVRPSLRREARVWTNDVLNDPLDDEFFRLRFLAEESRCSNAYAPHRRELIPMEECTYGLLMANQVQLGGIRSVPKWLQDRMRRGDVPSNMVAAMLPHTNREWLELLDVALPAAQRDFKTWRIESGRPLGRGSSPAAEPISQASPIESTQIAAAHDATDFLHDDDFTWVVWCGRRFTFSSGNQAEIVRRLWSSWEKSGRRDGCGMSEASLRNAIGSAQQEGKFRVSAAFRDHEALGTMIRDTGQRGVYALFRIP